MTSQNIPVYSQKDKSPLPSLGSETPEKKPFVIVGSGPAGLVCALDLARKGQHVILVTAFDFISEGSKGICYAKQSLDIFNRLGVGDAIIDRGVNWNIGKVFWGNHREPIYRFDMLSVKDQKSPGFVNIQQYYVEEVLVDALEAMDNVDVRWGHTVTDVKIVGAKGLLQIETDRGAYQIEADYILACDGNKSFIRNKLKLDFKGRVFEDNFLIADVKLKHDHPNERYFWFDPPFNPGRTALLHKQPDDVWRLDFQLGWDVDREEAVKPENVESYVKGMLGADIEFEEVWYSIYTFQCRRMERFVHGPIIFVGDSAHLVSPFGARGANSGIADAENIAWKLDLVLRDKAPKSLIESYNYERTMAADENILNSTRSTDFMVPKNKAAEIFKEAVLELAKSQDSIRPFINSGRLSTPTPYHQSPLSLEDMDEWRGGPKPGHPCVDAPLEDHDKARWLLEELGDEFVLIWFGENAPDLDVKTLAIPANGLIAERYAAADGSAYLVRPDSVVAARWKKRPSQMTIAEALNNALGIVGLSTSEPPKPLKAGSKQDRIFQAIMDMHDGLDDEAANRANTRLILLLAEQIASADAVAAACALAKS